MEEKHRDAEELSRLNKIISSSNVSFINRNQSTLMPGRAGQM